MGMFDNYNISPNFPNNLTQHFPQPPQCGSVGDRGGYPFTKYSNGGITPDGYYWYYGDIIHLEFTIEGELVDDGQMEYIDIQDYVSHYPKLLTISNFRGESVIEQVIPSGDPVVSYTLTSTQAKLMMPGTYKLSLKLVMGDSTMLTLIGKDECTINIL